MLFLRGCAGAAFKRGIFTKKIRNFIFIFHCVGYLKFPQHLCQQKCRVVGNDSVEFHFLVIALLEEKSIVLLCSDGSQ